jgi:hypothetical protein
MINKDSSPFFDYELALRSDIKFRHQLEKQAQLCQSLAIKAQRDIRYEKQHDKAVLDLLQMTRWNLSPLLPYYFPKYPKREPFSLRNFPYAYAMFNLTFGRDSVMCIKGSRQIIKSTCLGIRDILSLQLFNGLRSMLVTPRVEQLKTLADKYKEISQNYRFDREAKKYRKNLFYKEWPNDSILKLVYILSNADKVRGNSMDWLNFDEYQDFDSHLELEVMEILTQSDKPMVTKTGTSKTTDSALEATYETTSRSVWRMTCDACNHDNYPTLEHNVMDMIQPRGVCCVKCGAPLNVRDGQWDHESPKMLEQGRVGLHVPKIIVPENTERPDKWYPIYQQSLSKNRKSFLEEVLGIATQEGAREITAAQLEAICTLGTRDSLQRAAMKYRSKYMFTVSGVDWGGSDYIPAHNLKESYTVHAMIGITPQKKMELIHFAQYEGMDYKEVADDICANHTRMNGYALASDFGVGQMYNQLIRERINPLRHIIFTYTGPNSAFISESPNAHMFNQLSLNKTDSITALFNAIKSHDITCFNWGEAADFLNQFTNLVRNPTDAGNITYRRHGARPDDALHAVNFAMHLAKMVTGQPIFQDEALKTEVLDRFSRGAADYHDLRARRGGDWGVVSG